MGDERQRIADAQENLRFAQTTANLMIDHARGKLLDIVMGADISAKEKAKHLGISTQRVYQLKKKAAQSEGQTEN